MKRVIYSLTLVLSFVLATNSFAQKKEAKVVKLTQVEGAFTKEKLNLKAGEYVFEVHNKNVGKAVGLVIAPATEEGKAGEHIKEGYLAETVTKGNSSQSKVVTLKPGTYKYFCPLNPTPEYTITVK